MRQPPHEHRHLQTGATIAHDHDRTRVDAPDGRHGHLDHGLARTTLLVCESGEHAWCDDDSLPPGVRETYCVECGVTLSEHVIDSHPKIANTIATEDYRSAHRNAHPATGERRG